MTDAVQQLLTTFDQLPLSDQRTFLKKLQNRIQLRQKDFAFSPLEDEDYVLLASQLFKMYEEEEGSHA